MIEILNLQSSTCYPNQFFLFVKVDKIVFFSFQQTNGWRNEHNYGRLMRGYSADETTDFSAKDIEILKSKQNKTK